jgi:ketosteroid isomerase-like protein
LRPGDLDTVRAFLQAAREHHRDLATVRSVIEETFTPDAEWHTMRELPGGGVRRGRDAIAAELADQWNMFDDFTGDLEELRAVGDQAVTRLVLRTRARGGAAEITIRVGNIWTFRDGKILRVRAFRDPDEAVAVAEAEAAE